MLQCNPPEKRFDGCILLFMFRRLNREYHLSLRLAIQKVYLQHILRTRPFYLREFADLRQAYLQSDKCNLGWRSAQQVFPWSPSRNQK